jgi:hypothetical protein
VTTLERTRAHINFAPIIAALAIAAAFAAGIVIGGPVLNLSFQPTPWAASQQLLDSGRAWELQRAQQAPQFTIEASSDRGVIAGGQAWEAERRQVIPRHR